MGHAEYDPAAKDRRPWNVGRMVGAKRALKPQQVWAIRFWRDREGRLRDRAMFDLAIDSKLRGCDVVKVKIGDLDQLERFIIRDHPLRLCQDRDRSPDGQAPSANHQAGCQRRRTTANHSQIRGVSSVKTTPWCLAESW